jgi:hypothetical protein
MLLAAAALGVALAPQVACLPVFYPARQAPLGDPASPALRIAGVSTGDRHTVAGQDELSGGGWAWPVVTKDGLKNRNLTGADSLERTVLWAVLVQGGSGVDVIDMTWSPPWAPRCAGGHPALELLLDLQATPNHVLAPEVQVHWERPVVIRGERVLSGRFDEDRPLLGQASVIDVRLVQNEAGAAREVCVRVPANGAGVTY